MNETHAMRYTQSSPWELTFTELVEVGPEPRSPSVKEVVETGVYDLFCDEVKLACLEVDSIIVAANDDADITDQLLATAATLQMNLNGPATAFFGPDVKYFILFCGIFNPKRSPVEHWVKYEQVFVKLLAKNCWQNVVFWQAIVLFFMRFYPQI
jgi:hypothetical protein